MPTRPKTHTQRQRDARRAAGLPATDQRVTPSPYDWQWQKARKAFLQEHPLCRLCEAEGRTTAANVVDHIIPHKGDRALFDDQENWQALCAACHNRKTALEDKGAALAMITLVCGAPGSGKTRYVELHRRPGDVVVDVDALFSALTGLAWYEKPAAVLPFVAAARDAVLARLMQPSNVRRAWVITAMADPAERRQLADKLRAEVVMVDADEATCLQRIAGDARRRGSQIDWRSVVKAWFDATGSRRATPGG